jgi:hypothetical protein
MPDLRDPRLKGQAQGFDRPLVMRRGFLLFATLITVTGCARLAASGSPFSTPEPIASASAPTPEATALPAAIDLLDCDGAPSEMGGLAGDFPPEAGGDTPGSALASFLSTMAFTLPRSGYETLSEDADGGVYGYGVDGRTKVVIVIGTRLADMVDARFTIDELRSCDPTEFGPTVDMGEATTVWAHPDGGIIADILGPTHCDWQSMRILHLTHEGQLVAQYVRDPEGVMPPSVLLETYADGVEVPADASPSGYRHGDQELWFSESDTALYVVDSSGAAERWPKTARVIGCA